MSVMSAILLYSVIWIIVLFMVLPFGIRESEELVPGQAKSAPKNPMIVKKLSITSLISIPLSILAYYVIEMMKS